MSPPAAAAEILGLPPGYRFVPKEKELVEFYLLPRARGQPSPFPGVGIIEDDTAGSTQPWKLFKRHGRSDDDQTHFYVHATDAKPSGARQDRLVDGGFKWKSQKRVPADLRVGGGEKIKWSKHILSLHLGDGGSLGWVMHEYSIAEPPCPSIRICQIAFTGHGQKRKRVPDGYDDDDCESQPMTSQRPRVTAPPSSGSSGSGMTETFHQETEQGTTNGDDCLQGEPEPQRACNQDYASEQDIAEMISEMAGGDVYLELKEQAPTTEQQLTEMPSAAAPRLLYGSQRCCGVPDMGGGMTVGGVAWGGFY